MPVNITYRGSASAPIPTQTTVKNSMLTNSEVDGNMRSLATEIDTKATITAVQQAEASRALGQNLAQIQATGTQSAYDQAMKNLQFGSTLGLQGLQTGLQGAGALGTLGQQQFQQGVDLNKLQQAAGATQQTAEQQKLDLAQQDFLKQQNYPYQQLAFMSDMLRGLPLSQTAQSVYSAPPSLTSQLAGVGTTLGAA